MPIKSPVTCILLIQPATTVLAQPAPSDFTPFWFLCSGLLGTTGFDQIFSWLPGLGAGRAQLKIECLSTPYMWGV